MRIIELRIFGDVRKMVQAPRRPNTFSCVRIQVA